MAELERLRCVERWEIGSGMVVGVGAIAEDSEEGEVGAVFGGLGEALDLRCTEEFAEDESVGR